MHAAGLCTLVLARSGLLHVAALRARCVTTRPRPGSSPRPRRRSPAAAPPAAPSHSRSASPGTRRAAVCLSGP